jgi:hypothetical protein
MTDRNKHGLTRSMGSKVETEVRRRCGFGCVKCGSLPYQYHHFDPPFEDARGRHDPKGITLLCGTCHDLATRDWLSKETVAEHDKNPHCKQAGYVDTVFDLGAVRPVLMVGGSELNTGRHALTIGGHTYLRIDPPELRSRRWRLSADFPDETGKTVCRIVENELQVNVGAFDFETVKNRFYIRDADGNDIVVVRIDPPRSLFLDVFRFQGQHGTITANTSGLHIDTARVQNVTIRNSTIDTPSDAAVEIRADGSVIIGGQWGFGVR